MGESIPRFEELTAWEHKAVGIIRNVRGIEAATELANDFVAINATPEYTLAELVPIPAKCSKCKRNWVGRDAIRAPSLRQCRCIYCDGRLVPHPSYPSVIDAETARLGLFSRVGKHAAGRLLDGVEHNGFPSATPPLTPAPI